MQLQPINSSWQFKHYLKNPVTVPYLGIFNDNEISDFDYIDVSGKILRSCNFRFRDEFTKTVNFNNVECSFSLTFFRDEQISN